MTILKQILQLYSSAMAGNNRDRCNRVLTVYTLWRSHQRNKISLFSSREKIETFGRIVWVLNFGSFPWKKFQLLHHYNNNCCSFQTINIFHFFTFPTVLIQIRMHERTWRGPRGARQWGYWCPTLGLRIWQWNKLEVVFWSVQKSYLITLNRHTHAQIHRHTQTGKRKSNIIWSCELL